VHYSKNGKPTTGELEVNSPIVKDLSRLIQKAKKPVIIAGQGCNDSRDELKAFAEKLQIPVTTTLHALGCFDERNDLALNMLGMHGHPTPNFMVQESDLIICIGSRFDDRITGRMSDFVPEARQAAEEGRGGIIHVDIRLTENAKQIPPTFFVHSTGKKFLQTMNSAMENVKVKPVTDAWLENMRKLQRDFPVKIPHFPTETVTVTNEKGEETTLQRTRTSAQSVIAEMNRQLLEADKMDDTIFTTGVGIHQMVAAQLITWTQPRQMLSSGSLGTMGVSLGYSIGAKLANEQKIVISVDGDGSFNMTFTELKTLAEQKIPVKILLLDNDGQMMVEYWQRLFHDNRLIAVRNSHNPDYSTLAKAFGIKSIYCDCEEDLEEKMKEFLFEDQDEPVLFHARIERTPCLPLVAPGQPLEDMILEDIEVEVDPGAAPS
jgi:acetolactate synthase-1/2/3 large subunit